MICHRHYCWDSVDQILPHIWSFLLLVVSNKFFILLFVLLCFIIFFTLVVLFLSVQLKFSGDFHLTKVILTFLTLVLNSTFYEYRKRLQKHIFTVPGFLHAYERYNVRKNSFYRIILLIILYVYKIYVVHIKYYHANPIFKFEK